LTLAWYIYCLAGAILCFDEAEHHNLFGNHKEPLVAAQAVHES
jgi:hypothetical protein